MNTIRPFVSPASRELRALRRTAAIALLCVLSGGGALAAPLSVHPENPRYFEFRGKPAVIITSGEHYGAVLNLDFDYQRYLDTLAKDRLNGTRVWVGAYAETAGNFQISGNTLDPASGRFICPWARSDHPGYADGGNKFDLNRWDAAYFKRLRDFVAYASRRRVVVEVNLFCPMYEESMWSVCPLNPRNHINGVGPTARDAVLTLDRSAGLLPYQEAMVRKVADELRGFDNVYFEICNEPYVTQPPVPDDWQRHITDVLSSAMSDWRAPHLISWNIANGSAKVTRPHPAVSIFNFHYAQPPKAVAENTHLRRPIGDNETGFRGTADLPYRIEAWEFMLAGGALFNHLDYSFTVGHEDGSFAFPSTQPGGGGPRLREQFRILRDFLHGFEFVRMQADSDLVRAKPEGIAAVHVLAQSGRAYAGYLRRPFGKERPAGATAAAAAPVSLIIDPGPGRWRLLWLDPVTGRELGRQTLSGQGPHSVITPALADDLAFALRRR